MVGVPAKDWRRCILSNHNQAKFFQDVAPPDFMEGPNQINHPVRLMMAREAAKVGTTVLDVACNTCIDYPLMKSSGLRYTGIDFQEKFIKRAKDLYPDVDARIANAMEIPFPDLSYYTAYAKDLFEHLPPLGNEPNYQTAIKEIWRVCSRLMMLSFFHEPAAETNIYYHPLGYWDNTYSQSEINQFLSGIGAQSIEYRPRIGTLEAGYSFLYLVRKS